MEPVSGTEPEDRPVAHGLVATEVAAPPAGLDHLRSDSWRNQLISKDRL